MGGPESNRRRNGLSVLKAGLDCNTYFPLEKKKTTILGILHIEEEIVRR
jgi:hypothetical protein